MLLVKYILQYKVQIKTWQMYLLVYSLINSKYSIELCGKFMYIDNTSTLHIIVL